MTEERQARYDARKLVIEVDTGVSRYEIDLERMTDSAAALDWLLQVASKTWCRPQTLADLVVALDAACLDRFGQCAQAVFCAFEVDHQVDWRKRTIQVKKR